MVGRDIAVRIANCYGLDGPAIESRCGPPNLLNKWYRVSCPGVERPGHGVGAEAKEKSMTIPLITLWDFMGCSS